MIIYLLCQIVFGFIGMIFSFVELPSMPDQFYVYYNFFIDAIRSAIGFIGLFIPLDLVRILLPVLLIMINWDMMVGFAMWVFKKIPILGFK